MNAQLSSTVTQPGLLHATSSAFQFTLEYWNNFNEAQTFGGTVLPSILTVLDNNTFTHLFANAGNGEYIMFGHRPWGTNGFRDLTDNLWSLLGYFIENVVPYQQGSVQNLTNVGISFHTGGIVRVDREIGKLKNVLITNTMNPNTKAQRLNIQSQQEDIDVSQLPIGSYGIRVDGEEGTVYLKNYQIVN